MVPFNSCSEGLHITPGTTALIRSCPTPSYLPIFFEEDPLLGKSHPPRFLPQSLLPDSSPNSEANQKIYVEALHIIPDVEGRKSKWEEAFLTLRTIASRFDDTWAGERLAWRFDRMQEECYRIKSIIVRFYICCVNINTVYQWQLSGKYWEPLYYWSNNFLP